MWEFPVWKVMRWGGGVSDITNGAYHATPSPPQFHSYVTACYIKLHSSFNSCYSSQPGMDLDELFMSEEEIAAANAIAGLRYLPGVEDIGIPQETSLLPARDTQTSKEVISDINYDIIKTKYAPPEPDSLEFSMPKTPPEIARAMGEESVPLDELEAMFMPHSDSGEAAEGDVMKTEPSSATEGSATCPGIPQSAAGGTDLSSEAAANSDYIEAMFNEEEENQQGEGGTDHVPAEPGEVAVSNGETTTSGGIDQQPNDQNKSEEASDSFSVQIDSLFRSIAEPDHPSSEGFEVDDENTAEHNASVTNGTSSGLNAVEYSSGNMGAVLQGVNITSGQISTSASSAVPVAVASLTDSTQTVVTDLSSFLGLVPGQGNSFNYSSQPSQVYLVSSNTEGGTELRNVQGQLVCAAGGTYVTTTIDVTAIQHPGNDDTIRTLNYSSQNEGTVVGQSGKRQRGQNGDEGTPAAKVPRVTDEESGISSTVPQNDTGSHAENGSQRRRAKHNHGSLPILLEKDVGIEAYISPNIKGFTGIIKER